MFTSQHPQSFFLRNIFCTNVVFNEKLEAVTRNVLWNLQLKRRENATVNVLANFTTEEERIKVIETEFGVKLTQEEREGIKGRKVAVENFDAAGQEFEY
jgi:3-phenylpropionate/cinnamic acid dioxygenase small subunit